MSLNLNQKQKTLASAAGIIAIVALCAYLLGMAASISVKVVIVITGAFFSLIPATIVYDYLIRAALQPSRLLKKNLRACGFVIDSIEWTEDKEFLQFFGKFHDNDFQIIASPRSPFVNFYYMPWFSTSSSNPTLGRMMEAINDTNASSSNMSIIMTPPDENGTVQIYTRAKTILPFYHTQEYLNTLMAEMLRCKPELLENFLKDKPWLKEARRGPVGFHVNPTEEAKEPEESPAPAATENTPIN